MAKTFAERFCEQRHLPADKFLSVIFRMTLHRWALPLLFFLRWNDSNYFAPDREFIRAAGQVRNWRELQEEVSDFNANARHQGLLRGVFRARVSARRMLRIASAVLAEEPPRRRDFPAPSIS